MLCRAKLSSVSQVGLDAATDSVLFFLTGGVSFCSGVDRARGSFGEPKVTPPFLVYTLSDVTSAAAEHVVGRHRDVPGEVEVPEVIVQGVGVDGVPKVGDLLDPPIELLNV